MGLDGPTLRLLLNSRCVWEVLTLVALNHAGAARAKKSPARAARASSAVACPCCPATLEEDDAGNLQCFECMGQVS